MWCSGKKYQYLTLFYGRFVPPSHLQPHRADRSAEKRRTQEQFREGVLKIQDKDKEAVVKRRSVVGSANPLPALRPLDNSLHCT